MGDFEVQILLMSLSPFPEGNPETPVFVAAVVEPSWQVPSSHNFRLMDPLGYAAGEAQFVDGRQGWLDCACACAQGITFGSCFSCHRGQKFSWIWG